MTTMLVEMEEWRRAEESTVTRAQVQRQQGHTREALLGLRSLVYDLRGDEDTDPSLGAWVADALLRLETTSQVRTGLVVDGAWPDDLPVTVRHHLRRIVEEALTNAVRHSGATRVEVRLAADGAGRLDVSVTDDGRGLSRASGEADEGIGLRGMRERALALGARLDLASPPHGGTTVRVSLPARTGAAR